NPSATPKAVPSTPPMRKIASPRQNPMNTSSVCAGQAPHGELDAAVGELAPRLHFRHVGGLGEAGKPLARSLPRRFARQRKGLAAEAVEPVAPRQRIGGTSGKVAWARGFHGAALRLPPQCMRSARRPRVTELQERGSPP